MGQFWSKIFFLRYNVCMSAKNIAVLSEQFKSELEQLDIETLKVMVDNHSKAVEYVKKGIVMTEWSKSLTEEQIETIAKEAQAVAKMFLQEKKAV